MTFARSDESHAEELLIRDRGPATDPPAFSNESAPVEPASPNSIEYSSSLENSAPLEAPRVAFVPVARPVATNPPASVPEPVAPSESMPDVIDAIAEPSSETPIRLWEERLIVDRQRRKVGEVVVRKEVETRTVEIPIRRERLIVEQIAPEYEELAVVDLGDASIGDLSSIESIEAGGTATVAPTITGEFMTIDGAIQFLTAIASEATTEPQTVKISIVSRTAKH